MIRSTTNHSVFYHQVTTLSSIQKLKQHLFSHFRTKDLRKLKYFLSIEVAQSNSRVVISKREYTLDILADTSLLD